MKIRMKILLMSLMSMMMSVAFAGNAASGTGINQTNSNETEPTTESHYATPGQTAAPETNTLYNNQQEQQQEQQEMQQEQQQMNQENQQFNNNLQTKPGGY